MISFNANFTIILINYSKNFYFFKAIFILFFSNIDNFGKNLSATIHIFKK